MTLSQAIGRRETHDAVREKRQSPRSSDKVLIPCHRSDSASILGYRLQHFRLLFPLQMNIEKVFKFVLSFILINGLDFLLGFLKRSRVSVRVCACPSVRPSVRHKRVEFLVHGQKGIRNMNRCHLKETSRPADRQIASDV